MAELLGKFETLKRAGWKPLARSEFHLRTERAFWCAEMDSGARAYAKVVYPFWAACEDFSPTIGMKAGVTVSSNEVFPFATPDRANCLCISPVIGERQQSLGEFFRNQDQSAFDGVARKLSALLPYLEFIGHNDVDNYGSEKNIVVAFSEGTQPNTFPYPIDFEELSIDKHIPIKRNWAREYGGIFSIDEEAYARGVDGIDRVTDRFVERTIAASYKRFGLDDAPPPKTPSLDTVIDRLNQNKEYVVGQKQAVESTPLRSVTIARPISRRAML